MNNSRAPGADAERRHVEQEYTRTAFDYTQQPVGSRDWCLFWDGWQAARAATPAGTDGAVLSLNDQGIAWPIKPRPDGLWEFVPSVSGAMPTIAAGAPAETPKLGFEAWWTGRALPDDLKPAFFMVWQAALEDGEPGPFPAAQAAPVQPATGADGQDAGVAGALHDALTLAAKDMPDGFEIRICIERGSGWVEWSGIDGEAHHIEGEGYLSDDVHEAIAAMLAPANSEKPL
jgi:hypothetical protein